MFDFFLIVLVTSLLCLVPVLLFYWMAESIDDILNYDPHEIISLPKRAHLQRIADVLHFKLQVGDITFPFSHYPESLTFLHQTPQPTLRHRLIGQPHSNEVQLFEFECYEPAKPPSNHETLAQHLVLLIENEMLNLPLFKLRNKTWLDSENREDGFTVEGKLVWGEDHTQLRAVFDWEIVTACRDYPGIVMEGVGKHIVLAWPMEAERPFRWPPKEKVLDFVALGEKIAAKALFS